MLRQHGRLTETSRFEPFGPVDILYEFDGPRIFTVEDADGELNLAYWSDEDEFVSRYVAVPTTSKILASLREGGMSVFDALNQPRCWLCDVKHNGEMAQCLRVDFDDISKDSLPVPGTRLLPTLETEPINLEGRIRELDVDRFSFELREINRTPPIQKFVFDKGILDDVLQAVQTGGRVKVTGRNFPVKNLAFALALSRVLEPQT